jgi:sugar phosphate isomerase/epimerase
MMDLGIFAKTFPRPTFGETLDAITAHGFRNIQFNFSCVGLPTLPSEFPDDAVREVQRLCEAGGMAVAGVSGTFNLIDPDLGRRREGLRRLGPLAQATRRLGCELITLCTGTRDPEDMWRHHPENSSPIAWRDLLAGMEEAIGIADRHGVLLGVEPEIGNIVSSTRRARQLLDELHSSRVKIILDAANLFHPGESHRMRDIMDEAFQLLGTDIVMVHAKELTPDGAAGHAAPGKGILDWDHYFNTLAAMDFRGPIVLHGLKENDVPASARFLRSKLWE